MENGTHSQLFHYNQVETLWLFITWEAGFFSIISTLLIFAYIFRNAYRYKIRQGHWPSLYTSPMDVYLLSLFLADLVHGIADTISLKWASEGNVHAGATCTAQGILMSIGSACIANSSIAIAAHSFAVAWFRKGIKSGQVAMTVVAIIWMYSILLNLVVALTYRNLTQLFGPTPYWCWIANDTIWYMVIGNYLWLGLAVVTSLVVYIPLFFLTCGWRKIKSLSTAQQHLCYCMIVYPVIYAIIIIPLIVVRWHGFVHGYTHGVSKLVTEAIWGSSGILDVILFFVTRPTALQFDEDKPKVPDGQYYPTLPCPNLGTTNIPMQTLTLCPDTPEGVSSRVCKHGN